jgi:predicted acylesterase/phospholipase RssA
VTPHRQADARPIRFALVLGGGAARGAAHIGVLRALLEDGLEPDLLVGVSIGAVIGAGFAVGEDARRALERLHDVAEALQAGFVDLGRTAKTRAVLGLFGRRQRRARLEGDLGLKGLTFEALRLPLLVTATRLFPPGRVVLGDAPGDRLVEAVMASSAPPSRLPARCRGQLLVDGALTGNLPTEVALRRGAGVIAAVNLGFLFTRRDDVRRLAPWRVADWVGKTQMRLEAERCRRAGATVIEIGPGAIDAHSILAFERLDKLVECGYKATQLSLPAIRGALLKERPIARLDSCQPRHGNPDRRSR